MGFLDTIVPFCFTHRFNISDGSRPSSNALESSTIAPSPSPRQIKSTCDSFATTSGADVGKTPPARTINFRPCNNFIKFLKIGKVSSTMEA